MTICRIPQFDPSDIAHNMRMLPCDTLCIERSTITGFTLTNQVGTSMAVHFSQHEEHLITLFCFWFWCMGYDRIDREKKLVLMAFLADRLFAPTLRTILEFIFDSRGDILITPIKIQA